MAREEGREEREGGGKGVGEEGDNVHRTFTCTCTLYIVSMYMYMACMSLPKRNRRAFMYMCTSHQWSRGLCGSHLPLR